MVNQNNGIDRNAHAFKEGLEYGKKWVEYYRESGKPIEMPIFEPPKDIENQYYQSGVMEAVNKAINFKRPTFFTKKNTRPNSIDRMAKEKGPNFIAKLGERGAKEVTIFADRVLQDICHSNVLEISKYKNLFENQKFLQAMFTESSKKFQYYYVMSEAVKMFIEHSPQQNEMVNGFLNYHLANQAMYQLIFNKLNDFKSYLDNGVFNPDPLIQAQREIYKEGWNRIGRDPYSKTRVW